MMAEEDLEEGSCGDRLPHPHSTPDDGRSRTSDIVVTDVGAESPGSDISPNSADQSDVRVASFSAPPPAPPAVRAIPETKAKTAAAVDDLTETMSTESDLECPVCYQPYCEPVFAGCGRHVFCRHCLWQSQRDGELRCPVCRAKGPRDVQNAAEVEGLIPRLRKRDPEYDERANAAREERERVQRLREAWQSEAPFFVQVSGAGCEEVNGSYVVEVLPAYLGPTIYRKPNTFFFIFRWHRTQWVLAELRRQSRMGNERTWLYTAPTQIPPDLPPARGWEVPTQSRASAPAPEVQLVPGLAASQQTGGTSGRGTPTSVDGVASESELRPRGMTAVAGRLTGALGQSASELRSVQDDVGGVHGVPDLLDSAPAPAGCHRCTPPCSVM